MITSKANLLGHRSVIISGRISPELDEAVSELIKSGEYITRNDVVEEALTMLVLSKYNTEEGC